MKRESGKKLNELKRLHCKSVLKRALVKLAMDKAQRAQMWDHLKTEIRHRGQEEMVRCVLGCCMKRMGRVLGSIPRAYLEQLKAKGGGGSPQNPLPPPSPDQRDHRGEKTKFTIGKIWSGHFWYTKFWVQNPLPPSPPPLLKRSPAPPSVLQPLCPLERPPVFRLPTRTVNAAKEVDLEAEKIANENQAQQALKAKKELLRKRARKKELRVLQQGTEEQRKVLLPWKKLIMKLVEESNQRNQLWSHLQTAALSNRKVQASHPPPPSSCFS